MFPRGPSQEILNWRRRRRENASPVLAVDLRHSARRLTVNDREVLVVRRGRTPQRLLIP